MLTRATGLEAGLEVNPERMSANLQRTGLSDRATVTRGDVLAWLHDPARSQDRALVASEFDARWAKAARVIDTAPRVAGSRRAPES